MANNKNLNLKDLILLSNSELEIHNFEKSIELCRDALKIDPEDPNIYLILLLAKYQVTEIEDLEDCKVDYESELYKNLRKYADKELNDELNKHLSDKVYVDSDSTSSLELTIEKTTKNSSSSGLIQYIKNEFKTLFEKPKNSVSEPILSKAESSATLFMFFGTFFVIMISLMGSMMALMSDKYYIDTICFYFILYLFWTKVIRINKSKPISEDELPDKNDEKLVSCFYYKMIKHLVIYLFCMVEINCCFIVSFMLLFHSSITPEKPFLSDSKVLDVVLGFLLGLISGLTVTYAYQKIYNFSRDLNYIRS